MAPSNEENTFYDDVRPDSNVTRRNQRADCEANTNESRRQLRGDSNGISIDGSAITKKEVCGIMGLTNMES